uniref:IQ domain-containing protein K-like n=1 Tax=Phallusia mammillata TaxID=59560 RepID=A0A6F9DG05_9ASCI|nr:IQ domain-containing protein K-like [Phallusia mammillata]
MLLAALERFVTKQHSEAKRSKMATPSPKFFGEKKVKTLWEEICDEFSAQRALFEERDFDDNASIATDITQFSARRHTPVVYGQMVHHTPIDANVAEEFDAAVSHPAAVGLTMLSKPEPPPTPPPSPPPDPKTCAPREYLEAYVFPVLTPALIAMLNQAKIEKCFERKRTKFNGCDFLTEYLYKNNPHKSAEREGTSLLQIPFVETWLQKHPRKPLPLSLQWNEEQAAVIIQSFYRGHMVRCREDVAELRAWQRDWREENKNIREKVETFWEERESQGGSSAKSKRNKSSTSKSSRKSSSKSQADKN